MKHVAGLGLLFVTGIAWAADGDARPKSVAVADKPVAEKKAEATDYVRFVEGDDGDSLETAIVRFESPDKGIILTTTN